jgi:hypothetical protein
VSAELSVRTTEAEARETPWPSVTAVIPTRNRPELLTRSAEAILAQDYPGELKILVVVDHTRGDVDVPDFTDPRIRVINNDRTPGLAGGRNTGTLAADTDLIAFCDDDDVWMPGKLRTQVEALERSPEAAISTTAIEVDFEGHRKARLVGAEVTHDLLCRRRLVMVHSSSVVAWRRRLLGDLGLQDETIPGHSTEDWDLQLRASAHGSIAHIDQPLVLVKWWAQSFFATDWDTKIKALKWMLDHHPGIGSSREGAGRVYGQLAFAYASQHQRREALGWIWRTLLKRPIEPRAYLALLVVLGVPPWAILKPLHRRGHGV